MAHLVNHPFVKQNNIKMDKLGDMDLFVRVVRNGGLAAAGREIGLSPARMTARMNGLEQRYGVRLLTRTTRQVTLTEEGREFFNACENVLAEVKQAEGRLQAGRTSISGPLRITATSDLGQQHVAPVLERYIAEHPDVEPYLYLTDGVVNLAQEGFDLGVRYGVLADSGMIAKKLAKSHRILCASPRYLKRKGTPRNPDDLANHDCLVMVRSAEPLVTWHFQRDKQQYSLAINPARSSNDGAMIRRWALEGAGIALKSYCDVAQDIKEKRLKAVLSGYAQDFGRPGVGIGADLHVVYPSRKFLPERVRGFIQALRDHFDRI
ncbi:MAG: LysR family transcriptional regulator [Halioglobus sp.]